MSISKKFKAMRHNQVKGYMFEDIKELQQITNSPFAAQGNVQYRTIKTRGFYITDEYPINPMKMNKFKIKFYIKALSPSNSKYSVSVVFKDFKKDYLSWRNKSGWWHFDYPILCANPTGSYQAIVVEYPSDEASYLKIPSEAKFIEFGVTTSHTGQSVYHLSQYKIMESF